MSVAKELGKRLYYIPKPTRWSQGIGAELPEEYKKFWKEWKIQQPSPVHYIPKEGRYEVKEDGQVMPIQNVPLPLKYPKELDQGIWGGEAVVQGFYKKSKYTRRFVRYWVPQLLKSVVYSEVLDKHMRMTVTQRTLKLIHENYGFDHYLLKTSACDLRSLTAVQLKREILIALADKTLYPTDPAKKDEVYQRYQHYLSDYTRDEIEWYGLSYAQACDKHIKLKLDTINKPVPLKLKFREELINRLKEGKSIDGNEEQEDEMALEEPVKEKTSWISKINPFAGSSKSS